MKKSESPTLQNIMRHWIGELPKVNYDANEPGGLKTITTFPFHLENFCAENDAWLNLLLVKETDKEFFVKRQMHPLCGSGYSVYEGKERQRGQKPIAFFVNEDDLTRFLHGAKG